MNRKLYGNSPTILALTANATSEDEEACLSSGMNKFLTKPIDLKALIQQFQEIHKKIP